MTTFYQHSNLKFLRKRARLSQQELAERVGVNRGNIASYEFKTNPPLDVLLKICEEFGLTTDMMITTDLRKWSMKRKGSVANRIEDAEGVYGRVENLLKILGVSRSEFSKTTGIDGDHFELFVQSHSSKGISMLQQILNTFPWINPDWLLMGAEPVTRRSSSYISEEAPLSKVAEPVPEYGNDAQISEMVQNLAKRVNQIEHRLDTDHNQSFED